jgi:hypothetical protein
VRRDRHWGAAEYSRTDLGHLAKFVPRDKASEEAMSRITRSPMRAIPAHFNSYHVNIKGVPFAVTLKEVILCGTT